MESLRSLRLVCIVLPLLAIAPGAVAEKDDGSLLLATTTSVRDSGLLDALLPVFAERTGITVQVVAVGTGAALRMGREGNADVLVTHAEAGELELVAAGAALARTPFMENHFVIAGPPEDPARVAEASDPADAYRRIAAAPAPYVSRGDDSGTHRREKALLAEAGLAEADAWTGFAETGSGMGLTLQVAGERRAYALSDIGTFLAYRERTGLERLSGEAAALRNEYSVLRIDPARLQGRIDGAAAVRFEAFLVAPETQRRIEGFGRDRFGAPLFQPLLARPAEKPPAK
jgi:tungstate transport system substrate-binding protein